MTHPKRILITGATGAIGGEMLAQLYPQYNAENITVLIRPSKKANKLIKNYPGIRVLHGSVTSYEDVVKACEGQDMVVHLAGIIPPAFDKLGERAYRTNTEGTRNVVRALEEKSPEAFLLFSSSVAVYGDRLKTPVIRVEDELPLDQPDQYAISKIEAESIVQNSKLNWSVFRLTAIMGVGNHKVSKIIFHVPLETQMEIATVKDTARALVLATQHTDQLKGRTFNLAGGESCRITYEGFLTRAFDAFGLGKPDFPEYTFAKANFHCGIFADSDELENILRFRNDTLDSYFSEFQQGVPGWMRTAASVFRKPVKLFLTTLSEPRRAHRKKDPEQIALYFGDAYDQPLKRQA